MLAKIVLQTVFGPNGISAGTTETLIITFFGTIVILGVAGLMIFKRN